MKTLAVSVVVSVYNGEMYLAECLESILAQTLRNIEIICVDDASTDATPQILGRYQERIMVLTNIENRGAGVARNRGMGAASGRYLLFLDADDIFEPDMLEKAFRKAQRSSADICIFREDEFTDRIADSRDYPYADAFMNALGEMEFFEPFNLSDILFNLWNGWAWDKLFRREFILNTGITFPDIRTSEDGFFVHAAMASAERICFLNEVLVHHRVGNCGSLSSARDTAWESCLVYLEELERYLGQRNLSGMFRRSYVNWAAEFLSWNYRTLNGVNRRKLAARMQCFFVRLLGAGQYGETFFYNAFSYWFVCCMLRGEGDRIPVSEESFFQAVYRLNALKLDNLHRYLLGHNWRVALWGAGVRGQAFASVCGKNWMNLQTVYDTDLGKQGQELYPGLVIRKFDRLHNETDCILVLNAAHLQSVYRCLEGENVMLFDMNTYLTLPFGIGECLTDCRTGILQAGIEPADGGVVGK